MATPPDDDRMAELAVSSRPVEPPFPLRQCGGFWMPESFLPGVAAARMLFKARPSDILLVSFFRSGTTWLKALAFATLNRVKHPPHHPDHPLRRCNPHDCVKYLEWADHGDMFAALPSPRVLATHVPYTLLPPGIAAEDGTGGRIVYICRDPKDTLVSMWHFAKKKLAAEANGGNPPKPYTIDDAFELFSNGRVSYGPQWRHVTDYWEASQKLPDKVLFLRYEQMLSDQVGSVRKLAEFMGCAFSAEEEAVGVVTEIVELCSINTLKNMEVNKNERQKSVKNESFFRKGVVGDWSNHMTPAMAERLDRIVEDAVQGAGFTFTVTQSA